MKNRGEMQEFLENFPPLNTHTHTHTHKGTQIKEPFSSPLAVTDCACMRHLGLLNRLSLRRICYHNRDDRTEVETALTSLEMMNCRTKLGSFSCLNDIYISLYDIYISLYIYMIYI